MATAEGLPLCAIAQIDNKIPAHRHDIKLKNEDIQEKLNTIVTIWMLRCELEDDPLLKIESTCDNKKNNKRFYSYTNVSTQLPLCLLSNRPFSLPPLASQKKRESLLLDNPSLVISVDLQSLDGQIIVAQKKKPKSNKNNQKGKRNGDKAGQNKKHEEKDGSDEEDDSNNDAKRDSGKKEDDNGNKDNHGDDKKDEKKDEDDEDEDEVKKKVEEEDQDEEEKKVENEGEEKAEEDDDKNKEQEYNEESFYTITNSKKNKKIKSKKNGKNKAQPPDKPVDGLRHTSVNNDYHALNDLETPGNYQESLVLNANTMDGRDLDSSDKTIALDNKKEDESLSFEVKGREILKTTVSISVESGDNIDDGDTGSKLDDSQAPRLVKNSSCKKTNSSHTNELDKNTNTVLSAIDTSSSDVDRIENSENNNLNHGFEETEEDLGLSNPIVESFKIIDKKGKKQEKQEKKESQKSQVSSKNKISKKDFVSKLSPERQDQDLIQMPGAFNLDFLGNGNVPFIDKLDKTRSEIGIAPIGPTVEKTFLADNLTINQEVSQSDELAQEISLTPLNLSGDTENFLTQALTNESFFGNNSCTNIVETKKMRNQKSVVSTKISQEKIFEPNNINSDLTNDFYEPSNYSDENTESIALDKLIKSPSAISTDQKNPAITIENTKLKDEEIEPDINSKNLTPNIQPEPIKSRKEKKKEKALAEAEMKKSKARAIQQAKATRKKEIEDEDALLEIESDLKAEEQIEFNNTKEIQSELEAEEETESKSIKEIEFELECKVKALKNSKPRVGKQMKKIEDEQTLNSKTGLKKLTRKEIRKKLLLKDEDTIAACASQDEEGNIASDEPENINENSNMNILYQSTNPTSPEESISKLEANLNKTVKLQFNNSDINPEVVTEAQPGKDESSKLNQDRSLEEDCNIFNATQCHDKPVVVLGKESKSKSKASNVEKKNKEGNVANKLKSFEALQKRVTPLSSSKVQEVKEPHFSPKDDDFMINDLSPEEITWSKDVPGSFPQEYVDVNVENNGGKKSKKKKISKMKEDRRNPPMNGKIKHEDKDKDGDSGTMVIIKKDEQDNEEDLVDIIKVQHNYNEPEASPKLENLEELGDNRDLGKPEELDETGKLKKLGELEELGELEKSDELENLGELEEPGEPENSNEYQGDETNFDESSALILSEVPKIAAFDSLNLQPEVKTVKKKRPHNVRDRSPWGMLGVGPRKDVKRIAKRKSGDVKKVLRTKHRTPIKNPEKKESVRVSPPKRADKAVRPPISKGISSIFAAPIRSKSVSERRSSATRKPSSRRQSTSEAIGISSPFIGSGNKPEISLKAAKLLGVSPSPGVIPSRKAKTNPIEHEDNVFVSTKEDLTSPEKQSQNRRKKDDDDDEVIIESSGPSEPVMKRSESTRRTSIGGILSGLISSRSRPNAKRRSIVTEEDPRGLRREDRKIKQFNRGISEVKMSGGLTYEDQKVQRLAEQTQTEIIKKKSDENVAAEKIQKVRKSRRADRKVTEEAAERKATEEAAERKAAELSQKARRARRSERKAAEETVDKKVTENEVAEIAQKARRARRAEKKTAEEIAERKAAELAQKSRRAQRTERAERKAIEITSKREVDKKEAPKNTANHRGSGENTRRTSDEERRERHRRKEAELVERQNEEKEARRAARRSQRSKEKAEQRVFEGRHSEKNHAGEERLAMDDRRKDESYLEKPNYRKPISQIPEFDEKLTYGNKERRSSRAIARNLRPNYEELGLPVEYQATNKSLNVKDELNDRSNEQSETSWPDSMAGVRAKERLKGPLIPTSPLVSPFVEPKASTEHTKHREARKSDSLKYDDIREVRDERRKKRDSRRIQENLAIPNGSHGNERRSSHRSPTIVDSRTSSAQGGFLSRWKRLAGV